LTENEINKITNLVRYQDHVQALERNTSFLNQIVILAIRNGKFTDDYEARLDDILVIRRMHNENYKIQMLLDLSLVALGTNPAPTIDNSRLREYYMLGDIFVPFMDLCISTLISKISSFRNFLSLL
jgi:hypothetical protein